MKFEVGDKVRIKRDLETWTRYGGYLFSDKMDNYKGKIATIVGIDELCFDYCLDIDRGDYSWTDAMLEKVEEEKDMKKDYSKEYNIMEIANMEEGTKFTTSLTGTKIFIVKNGEIRDNEGHFIWENNCDKKIINAKFKLVRETYNFAEAWEAMKKGKIIKSVATNYKYRIDDKGQMWFKGNQIRKWLELATVDVEEIDGEWYIYDKEEV